MAERLIRDRCSLRYKFSWKIGRIPIRISLNLFRTVLLESKVKASHETLRMRVHASLSIIFSTDLFNIAFSSRDVKPANQ